MTTSRYVMIINEVCPSSPAVAASESRPVTEKNPDPHYEHYYAELIRKPIGD